MAVYAPGDTPNDGAPNVDPGMFARIQQYLAGLSPIGSANAAEGPPPPPQDPDALARQQALAAAGQHLGPSGIVGGQPPANPADALPIPPSIVGQGGSSGGAGASGNAFVQPQHPSTMRFPMWPTPPAAAPAAPLPPSRPGGIGSDANFPIRTPGGSYAAPGQAAAPAAAAPIAPAAPTPFGMIARQNAPATQGQPGRGYQTALDLSGLFGQKSDMVPPPNAQPVRGGALSKAGTKGLLAGAPMPPVMPADIRRQRAIQTAALHSGYA